VPDPNNDATPYLNADGTLLVRVDVLASPDLVGRGLAALPFFYLPTRTGEAGPLVAYVDVADAIRWLERYGQARSDCAECGPAYGGPA
jgi:hypothetical protein